MEIITSLPIYLQGWICSKPSKGWIRSIIHGTRVEEGVFRGNWWLSRAAEAVSNQTASKSVGNYSETVDDRRVDIILISSIETLGEQHQAKLLSLLKK